MIEADTGAVRGKVNEAHKLRYTIEGECTGQTVTVKKGGADATTGTDYEYVEQSKKITFKTAGLYTVTLKASNGEKSISKSVSLEITEIGAPVLTMPQESSAYVNEQTDFAYQVTYDAADAKATESVAVTYKADAQAAAQTVTDNAEYYTLLDGKFTPKKTGEYTVTVSVTSVKSLTAQGVWVLTSLEEGMVLITKTEDPDWRIEDGKILVETNTATEFAFDTKGYNADRFTVAKSLQKGENDKSDMVVLSAAADLLTVTAAEAGDYVLTVTFTSKSDNTKVSSATWNIRVRDDITPPEFGTDPFDGTWDTLVVNMGLKLYNSATDENDMTVYYSLITAGEGAGTLTAQQAQIKPLGGDPKNGYYLVGTAKGTVGVKVTATDASGNTASATKLFTVAAVGAGETFADMKAYGDSVYDAAHKLNFNTDGGALTQKGQRTSAITKTGVIFNRDGEHQTDAGGHSQVGGVYCGFADNWSFTFKLTSLNTEVDAWTTIFMSFFTGEQGADGFCEVLWMNWNPKASNRVNNWYGIWDEGNRFQGKGTNLTMPTSGVDFGGANAEVYMRISRNVQNGKATLTFEGGTSANGNFVKVLEFVMDASTVAGNAGSKVQGIYFEQMEGRSFEISDITFAA